MTSLGHRIFVVEDEEMIRESIVEYLDENGYAAVGASDGRTFRERQLESPNLAAIPVIVFSAYRDVATAATEMKAVGHLEKPVRLPDLLRQVRQYCTNVGDHSRLS